MQQRSSSNNSSSGKSVERSATIPSTTAISEDLYRQNPFSPGDDSLSSFIKISSTSSSSPAVAADVATPVIHVSSSSSSRPFILNVGDQNRGSSSLGRESVLSSSSSSSLLATQQQQQQQHNTLAITQDPFATPPTVKGVAFLAIAAAAEEEDGENSISTLPTIPTQSNSTIVSPFYSELDDTVTPNLLNNNNNMTSSTTLSTSSSPLSLNIFKRSSSSTSLASSSAASGQQQQKSGRRSAIISSKDAMHLASLFRTELVRAVSFKSDSSGDISNIGSK